MNPAPPKNYIFSIAVTYKFVDSSKILSKSVIIREGGAG